MQAVPPGSPLPVVSPAAYPRRRVDVDYTPGIRAERLIASGRVVLAAFSLLAVWLDPPTPAKYVEITNLLLAGYATYAVGLAVLAWLARAPRRRHEMSQLASWPRTLPQDAGLALRQLLRSAAGVFGAPRALLVWGDADEPWLHQAAWADGDDFQERRDPRETLHPLVAEALHGVNFFCLDAARAVAAVLQAAPGGPHAWRGAPIHPALVSRLAMKAVLSLCVRGESVDGRLFVLDKRRFIADDLVLGEVVGSHLSESLDHLLLTRRLRQAAATEERVRLSRDLHDGVLQSLTGAALKLETAQRLLDEQPAAARQRLAEIQHLIADEQRNLRFFIRDGTLDPLSLAAGDVTLETRLRLIAQRLEDVWGRRVRIELVELKRTADHHAHALCHLVQH